MAMTGFGDGPPVRGGGALADFVGGLYLALGLVARCASATTTGARACSTSRTRTRLRDHGLGSDDLRGPRRGWSGSATSTRSRAPTTRSRRANGWVRRGDREQQALPQAVRRIGRPEMAEDPGTRTTEASGASRGGERGGRRVGARGTCDEVMAALGPAARRPCARVASRRAAARSAALRVAWSSATRTDDREVVFHGNPLQFSARAAPPRARARSASTTPRCRRDRPRTWRAARLSEAGVV